MRNGRSLCHWATILTASFVLTAASTVCLAGVVGSTNVVLDATLVTKPNAISGHVDVSTSQSGELQVLIEWRDNYGRLADHQVTVITVPAQTSVEFSLPTDVGLTMVNNITADAEFIVTGDTLSASTRSWELIPDPIDHQDYHANVWGNGSTTSPNYFAAIEQANVNLGHIFRQSSYYGNEYNTRPNHDFIEDKRWFEMTDAMHTPNYDLYEDALTGVDHDYNTPAKRAALIRPQSLSTTSSLNLLISTITPRLQATAKWRPMQWNIADEYGIARRANPFDYDLDPTCISQFITWLQSEYASLGELNTQWGTSFSSWSDLSDPINAPPGGGAARITCQEIRDREFPLWTSTTSAKNFSPWSDFRRHMELTMANAMQLCVDAGRAIDPTVPMGWEGGEPFSPMNSYDYWLQMQLMGSFEAYDIGNSPEYARSFRDNQYGDRLFRWVTMFNSGNAARNRYKLWFHLIHHGHRASIIWWYQDFFTDTTSYNLTSYAQGLAPAYGEFRSGLAKLLSQGEHEDNEVALYYSQRSEHVSWQLDSEDDRNTWVRRFGSYDCNHSGMLFTHTGWLKALEDIGLKGRFVSYEQITDGELISDGYKVLVMPRVMALDDDEIAAVQAFADAGGLVIADSQAAIYDGHCKRRSTAAGGGLMDDWFGISRVNYATTERNNDSSDAYTGSVELQVPPAGFEALTQGLPSTVTDGWHAVENGVRTGDGAAVGLFSGDANKPVLIAKNHGAGKSVYTNLTLHRYGTSYSDSDYTEDRRTPSSLAASNVRQLVSNLMALGGVTAQVNVLQGHNASDPPTGTEVYDLEKARYVDGDTVYLSCVVNSFLSHYDWSGQNPATTLFGQPGVTNADVTLVLDEAAHVYDVRLQQYLGYGTRINASQPVLEGGVFALLPYQVTALNVDSIGFDGKQRASLTVSVQTDAGAPGRHVLRLEVFDPNSDPMDHLTRNLVAPDGLFSGVIPFAVDEDLVGGLIRLTDVATGTQVDINITTDLLEPALLASEPPADGTLPKTQNNLMWLTFSGAIALPGGPALSVVPLGGGADVGASFDYSVEPDGVTLKAVEQATVLTNQTWYQVTPAAGLNVQPFALDVCTLIGDCNGSGRVTTADYSCVKATLAQRGDVREDLNGSARVTTADYSVVKSHLGDRAPVKP